MYDMGHGYSSEGSMAEANRQKDEGDEGLAGTRDVTRQMRLKIWWRVPRPVNSVPRPPADF